MKAGFAVFHLVSVRNINETTRRLTFDQKLEAAPGQFVMAWLPGVGEKPFSIASMNPFGLLVVDVGPFSHALHGLCIGDPLWIKGPLGQGFSLIGSEILLVGGGYGAAPLLPLAEIAREMGRQVCICLGARSTMDLLLEDDFTSLGCKVCTATEDGSRGVQGLVTGIVSEEISSNRFNCLYGCGPSGLLAVLAVMCKQSGLAYQLSWEAHMRCGMGLCGSCEVSQSLDSSLPLGWLACYDGPVFRHTGHKD